MKKILAIFMALVVFSSFAFFAVGSGNKKKPSSDEQIPISSDEYDCILASGDGYYLISKNVETYDSSEKQIGIVNSDGEWVLSRSSTNIFGEAVKNEEGKTTTTLSSTSLAYRYLGDGIFIGTLGVDFQEPSKESAKEIGTCYSIASFGLTCYFYNTTNGKSWKFSANHISPYEGDYMLASDDSWYFIVDKEGNITDLNLKQTSLFSPLSDGIFLNDGVFYNLNGEPVLDIKKYDLVDAESTYFVNGECEIHFTNPAGNEYVATIDKSGNFIKEPTKVELKPEDITSMWAW